MNVINKLLGGLALGMMLYSCGVVPITGRRSLNLVSDEEVLASSRTQYNSFVANSRKKGELVNDPRILKISERLIQATKTYLARNNYIDLWRQMQWEVNVVKSNQVNAFCMPGGKIIVYTGMANLVGLGKGADDELAAVIGHEIGHAIARHANERISRAQLRSMGGQVILGIIIGKTKRNRFRQRSVCNYKGFQKNEAYAKNQHTQRFDIKIYLLFQQEKIFFLEKPHFYVRT